MSEQPWDGKAAGRELLDGIVAAIKAERAVAELGGREVTDRDLAIAVLASPALREVNRGIMDGLQAEYQPKIKAAFAAEAEQFLEAAAPALIAAERERLACHMEALASVSGGQSHHAYQNAAREIRGGAHDV